MLLPASPPPIEGTVYTGYYVNFPQCRSFQVTPRLSNPFITTLCPNTFKIKFKLLRFKNEVHDGWAPSEPSIRSCVSSPTVGCTWRFELLALWLCPLCSSSSESPHCCLSELHQDPRQQPGSNSTRFREVVKQRKVAGAQRSQHPVGSIPHLRVIRTQMLLSGWSTCYSVPGPMLSAFISLLFLATTLGSTDKYTHFTEEETKAQINYTMCLSPHSW